VVSASTDVPKSIPDYNFAGVTSTLTIPVSSMGGSITDIDLTNVWISHTYLSDVRLRLTAPDGTQANLIAVGVCGSSDNFRTVTFDDAAISVLGATGCPVTVNGIFKPQNPLSVFNGHGAAGVWYLNVRDVEPVDVGTLNGWGLKVYSAEPCNVATATPTNTSTPTYTATPGGSTSLIGHVTIAGRLAPPSSRQSVPVTLTLRLVSGGPSIDYSLTTDNYGYLTATAGLDPGDYNWRVKNPQTLALAGTTTLLAGDNQVELGVFREGDADNNNCVSAVDFNILKLSYGKAPGQPGYDARADFNSDNTVSSQDFTLLKTNFNQCGAGPIGPTAPVGRRQ